MNRVLVSSVSPLRTTFAVISAPLSLQKALVLITIDFKHRRLYHHKSSRARINERMLAA
jgi:hypothetical protein